MEQQRAERLQRLVTTKRQRRQKLMTRVLRYYMASQGPSAIGPPAPELYLFQPFRDVIEDCPFHHTQSEGIEIFNEVKHLLPTFVSDRRTEKDAELVAIMKFARSTNSSISKWHLSLMTTYFFCGKNNTSPVGYPRILMLNMARGPLQEKTEFDELFTNCFGWGFWNMGRQIKHHRAAASMARGLVELCGLNPETATVSDMDALDVIIGCTSCADDDLGRRVATWKQAVYHALCKAHSTKPFIWRLLNEEHRRIAKA